MRELKSDYAHWFVSFKVVMNVILNLAGSAFAVSAIVVYSINVSDIYLGITCREDYYEYGTTPSPGPGEDSLKRTCLESRRLTLVRHTKLMSSAVNTYLGASDNNHLLQCKCKHMFDIYILKLRQRKLVFIRKTKY